MIQDRQQEENLVGGLMVILGMIIATGLVIFFLNSQGPISHRTVENLPAASSVRD